MIVIINSVFVIVSFCYKEILFDCALIYWVQVLVYVWFGDCYCGVGVVVLLIIVVVIIIIVVVTTSTFASTSR